MVGEEDDGDTGNDNNSRKKANCRSRTPTKMSRSANDIGLMCSEPPYVNPMTVASISPDFVPSVSPDSLCRHRATLFENEKEDRTRKGNGDARDLSSARLNQVGDFMNSNGLLRDPSIEMLLVFKVLIGRWPTANEYAALLKRVATDVDDDKFKVADRTATTKMYVRSARLYPLDGADPPVGKGADMRLDRRISHIIGFNGTMMFDVASRSHTFLVWVMVDGTVRVYTFASDSEQALLRTSQAFRIVNRVWRDYSPWPGSRSAEFSSRGLVARPMEHFVRVADESEPHRLLAMRDER